MSRPVSRPTGGEVPALAGDTSRSAIPADLLDGPLTRFGAFSAAAVPKAPGVYTIWCVEPHEGELRGGMFMYVGIAGGAYAAGTSGKGLSGRLATHASGGRSGDRFCIHVQDRFLLPGLTATDLRALREGALDLDRRVRDFVRRHLGFRFVVTETVDIARAIEARIKAGDWPPGRPVLNPTRIGVGQRRPEAQ
jgi:hypothetical protein